MTRRALFFWLLLAAAPAWAQPQPQQRPIAQQPASPEPGAPPTLTLEEALRTARARQPQLRQAHAGTQAAQARVAEARAPLLPQLSAQYGVQRTTANFISRPGSVPSTAGGTGTTNAAPSSTFDNFNYFSGSITANQLLYDFGQTSGRYHASQATLAATVGTERAAELTLALNVRAAYFAARANQALVAVARDNLGNQRNHLDQIEEFVNAGTRPAIDLATARTNLANAQVQAINAENNYGLSKAQLNQATGVERSTEYELTDDSIPRLEHEDDALEPLLVQALQARPEIASLGEQVRAEQLTLRSLEGNYAPSLGASAGFTQGGTALGRLGWNLSAGLTLTWQFFQGGLTRAQTHEAEAIVGQLAAQLDSERLQVRLEVEQVRLGLRAAKATVEATQDALVNAREQLRLAEGRYQTGVGNAVELSDAQLALTAAAAQRVQADYQLATARAQLLKALGRE